MVAISTTAERCTGGEVRSVDGVLASVTVNYQAGISCGTSVDCDVVSTIATVDGVVREGVVGASSKSCDGDRVNTSTTVKGGRSVCASTKGQSVRAQVARNDGRTGSSGVDGVCRLAAEDRGRGDSGSGDVVVVFVAIGRTTADRADLDGVIALTAKDSAAEEIGVASSVANRVVIGVGVYETAGDSCAASKADGVSALTTFDGAVLDVAIDANGVSALVSTDKIVVDRVQCCEVNSCCADQFFSGIGAGARNGYKSQESYQGREDMSVRAPRGTRLLMHHVKRRAWRSQVVRF